MELGTALPWRQPNTVSAQTLDSEISRLVAQVYQTAPMGARCRLIDTLLKPLGILSLAAIADGVFAAIRIRGAGRVAGVGADDLFKVDASHVLALVQHAQQVSVETVDSLVPFLSNHPGVSGSAVATLLAGLLAQRARSRAGTQRAQSMDLFADPIGSSVQAA